jgi:hypothetical protein
MSNTLDVIIEVVESQIENSPLRIPENGIPEKALMTFLTIYPNISEECVHTDGFNFIIWSDDDSPDTFYSNAWAVNPETKEQEFIAYYEFKVTPSKVAP